MVCHLKRTYFHPLFRLAEKPRFFEKKLLWKQIKGTDLLNFFAFSIVLLFLRLSVYFNRCREEQVDCFESIFSIPIGLIVDGNVKFNIFKTFTKLQVTCVCFDYLLEFCVQLQLLNCSKILSTQIVRQYALVSHLHGFPYSASILIGLVKHRD